MILLDTDVCVAYLRGVPEVVAHFHRHLDEDVGVSLMTAAGLHAILPLWGDRLA